MRILTVALILFGTYACTGPSPPGPPVRLAGDISDTIIVNSRWPKRLPVHVFDAKGRAIVGAPIRFERLDGAQGPITGAGAGRCAKSAGLAGQAARDHLTT